jgi:hypothetical protein
MAANDGVTISFTKVTILADKKKTFKLDVDGKNLSIPVEAVTFANYQNQLYRPAPSPKQKKVLATVKSLMRAAYMKGHEDGKAEN